MCVCVFCQCLSWSTVGSWTSWCSTTSVRSPCLCSPPPRPSRPWVSSTINMCTFTSLRERVALTGSQTSVGSVWIFSFQRLFCCQYGRCSPHVASVAFHRWRGAGHQRAGIHVSVPIDLKTSRIRFDKCLTLISASLILDQDLCARNKQEVSHCTRIWPCPCPVPESGLHAGLRPGGPRSVHQRHRQERWVRLCQQLFMMMSRLVMLSSPPDRHPCGQ